MNTIDLIICIVLAFGAIQGWHKGCIVQVISIAGLFIAVWLGARFGTRVGDLCGVDPQYATPAGFVVVLLATLCISALAGLIVRKIFRFAGFGIADILLGMALGIVKYLILLSVLFTAFDRINADYSIVGKGILSQSDYYRPVADIAGRVFPRIELLSNEAWDRFNRPAITEEEAAAQQQTEQTPIRR